MIGARSKRLRYKRQQHQRRENRPSRTEHISITKRMLQMDSLNNVLSSHSFTLSFYLLFLLLHCVSFFYHFSLHCGFKTKKQNCHDCDKHKDCTILRSGFKEKKTLHHLVKVTNQRKKVRKRKKE